MKNFRPNWKQLLIIAGFVVLFLLLMDMNNRLNDLNRLNSQLSGMNTEVSGLQTTQEALKAQIEFATSEAAVNQYARNSGMIREGEKLIVPLPVGTALSDQQATPPPELAEVRNEDIWWALFFGK